LEISNASHKVMGATSSEGFLVLARATAIPSDLYVRLSCGETAGNIVSRRQIFEFVINSVVVNYRVAVKFRWPLQCLVWMCIIMLSPPDTVGEGVVFAGCPSAAFVRPFVRSYIVITISHERLQRYWW